uniref:Uncharacterized protein n=1 Tax=Aegilops tauschii subsp. strangulata TaxID=200361 RepID=A0A453MKI5_AEGTS
RSLLPEHGRKADPVPVLPHTQPHPSPLSGEKMAAVQVASGLSVPLLSALLGGAVALVFLAGYLRRKRADIAHLPPSAAAAAPDLPKQVRPAGQNKKGGGHARVHHHHASAADKVPHLIASTPPPSRSHAYCTLGWDDWD